MATVFYPDVSHYQAGLSLKGAPAASAKATEGSTYRDPSYPNFRDQAAALGIPFVPYHYLRAGNGARQAEFCYSVAGRDGPLMLDVEANSGGVADVLAFTTRYRQLGGTVRLVYLPHWYWQQIGSPDLRPLASAGLLLVSSNYRAYSDSGAGWAPYGGVTPTIWQYTDKQPFNGRSVDFNAFKGGIDEFRALVTGAPTTGDDMALEGIDKASNENSEHLLQSIVGLTDEATDISRATVDGPVFSTPNLFVQKFRQLCSDVAALKAEQDTATPVVLGGELASAVIAAIKQQTAVDENAFAELVADKLAARLQS
jgi:Glycosyl hydrolases family 25